VEAHRERLDHAEILERQIGAIKTRRRKRDELRQCAVALHAQGLVELAGISAVTQARGATAAGGIGADGDVGPRLPFRMTGIQLGHRCGNLMPRNTGIGDQRIEAPKGVEVAAAKADTANP
jgi:hypothetical protein